MAQAVQKALNHDFDTVAFVLPRKPSGLHMRLDGRGSPLGEVMCVNCDKHTVARFDTLEVLAWLQRQGFVDVDVRT
jgi:hypothetical protein